MDELDPYPYNSLAVCYICGHVGAFVCDGRPICMECCDGEPHRVRTADESGEWKETESEGAD